MNRNEGDHGFNNTPSANSVTDSSPPFGNMPLSLRTSHRPLSSPTTGGVSELVLLELLGKNLLAPRTIETNDMTGLSPTTATIAAALDTDPFVVLQRALQAISQDNATIPRHQEPRPPILHSTLSRDHQHFNPIIHANEQQQMFQQLLVAMADYQRSLIALEQESNDSARRLLLMQLLMTSLHADQQEGGSMGASRGLLNNQLLTSSSLAPTLISSPHQAFTFLHDQQGGSMASTTRPVLYNQLLTSSSITPTLISSPQQAMTSLHNQQQEDGSMSTTSTPVLYNHLLTSTSITPTLISSPHQAISINSTSSQPIDLSTGDNEINSAATTTTSSTSVSSNNMKTDSSPAEVTVSFLADPYPQSLQDTLNHFKNNTKNVNNKRSKSQDRPRHPLTAYNFFFSDERRKILKDHSEGSSDDNYNDNDNDNEDGDDSKKDETYSTIVDNTVSEEEDQKMLLKHIERRREAKAKRRKNHGKTHGKIGFEELGIEIAKRWKELPVERLQYYQTLANQDLEKYKKEMMVFKNKKQQMWSRHCNNTTSFCSKTVETHEIASIFHSHTKHKFHLMVSFCSKIYSLLGTPL